MIYTEHGLRFSLVAPGQWRCVETPSLLKFGTSYKLDGRDDIFFCLTDAVRALNELERRRRHQAGG